MAQVVESLPSKHEDNFELSSNPNTKKKKKVMGGMPLGGINVDLAGPQSLLSFLS
jgi:phage gpG-like protein